MAVESIAGLVVGGFFRIVIENPAPMPSPAAVHQLPDFVGLTLPKAPDTAILFVCFPLFQIDVIVRVQRRDKLVAAPRGALRELR